MARPLLAIALAALALCATGLAAHAAPANARPGGQAPGFGASQGGLDRGWLTPRRVDTTKAVVATAATALLLWGAVLRRAGRRDLQRRLRDVALAGLGLLGLACWWNLSALHYSHYLHKADQYLYFTGARYFPELGYDRLYRCTAVAEAEEGRAEEVAKRRMRDVIVNELVTGADALADPQACKAHFSPQRWRAFRADVDWFRARIPARQWRLTQVDHGFNATPAWSILAVTLANTGPASDARILALALIDPALLVVMWACVLWAFGWRATCVAAVFWGTFYPTDFNWTGGAFLRQDWLAATVVSLCLLRKRKPAGAGFLLALASLIRVFPVLIGAGLLLKALDSLRRRRTWRLEPAHQRFALGGLAAAALVLPLSVAVTGVEAWPAFIENSRVHLATPLQNYLGLKTVLSYDAEHRSRFAEADGEGDRWKAWKEARHHAFEGRRWLFAALVVAYLVLLSRAVAGQEDWVAAALGIGLIPIGVELTGYYYSVLLGMGLLWTRRESIGVALCGLSALSWAIANLFYFYDEIYTWVSLAAVVFVAYSALAFAARARSPRRAR